VGFYVALTFLGFATYVAFPAVPPWMASAHGALQPTTRIVRVMWGHVGLHSASILFEGGNRYANDVAAMPSLHGAYPMLLCLFFWPLARHRWQRVLLVAYPLMMAFALVYGGEHYIVDILVGWLYAAVVYFGGMALLRRRDRRRAERTLTEV